MLQRVRAARQNQNGFTLIELLIVIVILGVLAGIVVFAVNGINNRGVTAACKADKKIVMTAVEAFYAQNSNYPASTAPAGATAAEESTSRISKLVAAQLIKEPPSTTNGYTITLDASGNVGPTTCP